MASNTFEAFLKGPSEIKQAKQILLTAVILVAFTVTTTIGLLVNNTVSGIGGELGGLLSDPTISITMLVLCVCAFFTLRGSIIAASILLINQLLDLLVLAVSPESSITVISVLKVLIFISAIRAAWYLRKVKLKTLAQNA